MDDFDKAAARLIEKLDGVSIDFHVGRKDLYKVFIFAVAANVVSSLAVMGTIGYLARTDRKKKEESEKQEQNNV